MTMPAVSPALMNPAMMPPLAMLGASGGMGGVAAPGEAAGGFADSGLEEAGFVPPSVYMPAPGVKEDAIDADFGKSLSGTLKKQYELDEGHWDKSLSMRDRLLEAVGKRIVELCKDGYYARQKRDGAIRECMKAINLTTPERESPLGPDGANIRTPLTFKAYQVLHAFLLEVTTGVRPFIKTEATRANTEDRDAVNQIEDLLDSSLTEQVGWFAVQDELLQRTLGEGTAFLYNGWERRIGTVRDYEILTPDNAESFGFKLPKNKTLLKPGQELRPEKGNKTANLGEIFDGEREVTIKNCPLVKVISYFDYVQYPARYNDSETATLSGHRRVLTIDQLRHDAKSHIIDAKQLKALEDDDRLVPITPLYHTHLMSAGHFEDAEDKNENDLYEDAISEANNTAARYSTQHRVELVECVFRFDGNGDDLEEDWCFTVETSTCRILAAKRLRGTKRPLQPFTVFDRPGYLYGMPIGQVLFGLQEESDIAANLALDAGAMNLTAIVEESRSASDGLLTHELHVGWNLRKVDEIREGNVKVTPLGTPAQDAFPSLELVEQAAEQATGANEIVSGNTSQQGRTATEANQAVAAGARRLKVGARRIQDRNVLAAEILLANIRRYGVLPGDNGKIAEPLAYALTRGGERIFGTLTLAKLQTPVKLFAHGDTINTNEQLKLQSAEKLWMMMERDQDFLGSSPVRKYNLIRYILDAYGVRNIKDVIGTLQEATIKEEEAKKNPGPKLPNLPPNTTPEYLASYLAENPTLAEGTIAMLQQIARAQETDSGGGEADTGQFDLAEQQLKHQLQMEQSKVAASKQAALAEVQTKAQLATQALDHKAQTHDLERRMSDQESKHQLEMQADSARNDLATRQAEVQHTESTERMKTQAVADKAKAAQQNKPKPNTATMRKRKQ